MASLSTRLGHAIEATGQTQSAVAEEAGLSKGAVSLITRGERLPRVDTATDLARALGVRVGWLVAGEGPMFANDYTVQAARGLHEVDGFLGDYEPQSGDSGRVLEEFREGFERHQYREFGRLSGVVRLVFTNFFARVMGACRENDNPRLHDPAWRGRVAGRAFVEAKDRAQEMAYGAGSDGSSESTQSWVEALGEMMAEWQDGEIGNHDIVRS